MLCLIFKFFFSNTGPTEVDECNNDPCAENESGLCMIWHENVGCSECENVGTNFKIDYDYPCVSCSDVMGPNCDGWYVFACTFLIYVLNICIHIYNINNIVMILKDVVNAHQ